MINKHECTYFFLLQINQNAVHYVSQALLHERPEFILKCISKASLAASNNIDDSYDTLTVDLGKTKDKAVTAVNRIAGDFDLIASAGQGNKPNFKT